MRKLNDIEKNRSRDFAVNAIFTYAIISCILCFVWIILNPSGTEFIEIALNSTVPSTITLAGTVIIVKFRRIKDDFFSICLYLSIIVQILLYAAMICVSGFPSIFDTLLNNFVTEELVELPFFYTEKGILVVYILNAICMLISLFFSHVVFIKNDEQVNDETISDGNLFG